MSDELQGRWPRLASRSRGLGVLGISVESPDLEIVAPSEEGPAPLLTVFGTRVFEALTLDELRAVVLDLARPALLERQEYWSRECWACRWFPRWEFILWNVIRKGGGWNNCGVIGSQQAAELRGLAVLAEGWWVSDSSSAPRQFVPLDEWEQRFATEWTIPPRLEYLDGCPQSQEYMRTLTTGTAEDLETPPVWKVRNG